MSKLCIVLALLFLVSLCGCSLDASLQNFKLSQMDNTAPPTLFSLNFEGKLIHTTYEGITPITVNDSPLFAPSASPAAITTATAKGLGDVTTIAAPAELTDIKHFIRHPYHDAPQPALSAPIPNFNPAGEVAFSPTAGDITTPSPATACTFLSPMPNSTCSATSVSVSLQDITTGTLSIQFNNGQTFDLSMARYQITQLQLGSAGKKVGSQSEARESGGPYQMDLISIGAADYSSSKSYLRQSDSSVQLVYSRATNYDFLKAIAVMPNVDLVFYAGYKPTVDRMGLYVSDKAMTYFRLVANVNPTLDDIPMFGSYRFVEYRNKIYFTLYSGSSRFKLFRMNLDATNVEQVTNFITTGSDDVGGLTVHNGRLYFTARTASTSAGAGKLFFLETDTNGNNLSISRFPTRNTANSDVGSIHSINGRLYVNWSSNTESGLHWVSDDHSQITKITAFADNYSFGVLYAGSSVLAKMDESLSDDRNSLFLFDTTQNQFTILADLRPEGNGYNWKKNEVASAGDRLFFIIQNGEEGGSKIYSTASDGSDLRAETDMEDVDEMVILGDRLFFLGFSGSNDKLYSISATKGGDLQQHSDLNPGGPDFVRSGNGLELYRRNDSTLLLAWDADAFEIKLDE